MLITNVTAYNNMVSGLQALGFSGFPPASAVDFTAPAPVKINATCVHAIVTQSVTGDNITPYTP